MKTYTEQDLQCWGERELVELIMDLQSKQSRLLALLTDQNVKHLDNETSDSERFGALMMLGILFQKAQKIIN